MSDEVVRDLTSDPVYQVNACLWTVRKAPTSSDSTPRPPLNRHGYALRALGFKLAASTSIKKALSEFGLGYDAPEPDVVLQHAGTGSHLVLECKTSSFGSSSTTAKQGRKLLAVCADPNSALGSRGPAAVLYVLAQAQAQLQLATLQELRQELEAAKLAVADSGVFGLSIEADGLWGELSLLEPQICSEFDPIVDRHLIVEKADEDDEDVRPIYLIPYDPAVVENQSEEEREYCSELLAQRLCIEALSVVGRSQVPDVVRLVADELFSGATYRLSSYWQAQELRPLKVKLATFMYGTLNRGSLKGKVVQTKDVVEISLADEDDLRTAIEILQRAAARRLSERFLHPQYEMFAEDDDEESSTIELSPPPPVMVSGTPDTDSAEVVDRD